jgi:hypothetical protein
MRLPINVSAVPPLIVVPESDRWVGAVVGIAVWPVSLVDYVVRLRRLEHYRRTGYGHLLFAGGGHGPLVLDEMVREPGGGSASVLPAITTIFAAVLPAVDAMGYHGGGPNDGCGAGHRGADDAAASSAHGS